MLYLWYVMGAPAKTAVHGTVGAHHNLRVMGPSASCIKHAREDGGGRTHQDRQPRQSTPPPAMQVGEAHDTHTWRVQPATDIQHPTMGEDKWKLPAVGRVTPINTRSAG